MTTDMFTFVGRIAPIAMDEVDRVALLHTRKDRKYLVDPSTLVQLLTEFPEPMQILEIDGRRWFDYESVYFDTPQLHSYRLAATKRPTRFKVRTRTYVDSGVTVLEVKTKDRRGNTVKHRRLYEGTGECIDDATRRFAEEFAHVAPYAPDLSPTLTSTYQRATLVLPETGARTTVDTRYRATDLNGSQAGLIGKLIVETKSTGKPSQMDKRLWRAHHRPVKISKYATGLAALQPDLASNRWHRILDQYANQQAEPVTRWS